MAFRSVRIIFLYSSIKWHAVLMSVSLYLKINQLIKYKYLIDKFCLAGFNIAVF
jgi:hypothetical protein